MQMSTTVKEKLVTMQRFTIWFDKQISGTVNWDSITVPYTKIMQRKKKVSLPLALISMELKWKQVICIGRKQGILRGLLYIGLGFKC